MTRYTVPRPDAARRVGVLSAGSAPVAASGWAPPQLPADQSRRLAMFIAFAAGATPVVPIIRGR
jgi:hypothetical protein